MIFFGGRSVSLRRDDGMVPHTVLRMVQRTPEYTSECRLKGGLRGDVGFSLFFICWARGSEEHEGTPLGGEARGQRRRGRRRGQRVVFLQSPLAVNAGKIPAELPLFPERRWRRPDDGVNAAITPPVGGRPGQPAAADGDEGIVVVALGGGGRAPPPSVEMTTARGLGLNLADSATDAAGESSLPHRPRPAEGCRR
jgi:hypothetical protein